MEAYALPENAELGFTAILHTWGQNMSQHVHLHLIVGGGGISKVAISKLWLFG